MSVARRRGIAVRVVIVACAIAVAPEVGAPVGAASGDFTVSPTTLSFPATYVGSTSSLTVTITNGSSTTQTPNFAGGAPNDPTNFGGSQNCAGVALDPGATCQFTYTFEPTTPGDHTSSTTIGIDSDNFSITMSGHAEFPLTVAPTDVSFPDTTVGDTSSMAVVVTNVSPTALTPNYAGGAPTDPTNFGGSQNCAGVSLAGGQSCQFTYTFTPSAPGPWSTSTTIDVDGQNFAISLHGTGVDESNTTTTEITTSSTSTDPSNGTATPAPSGGGALSTAPSTTTGATTTTAVERLALTGEVIASRPALVVKVDNVDAEPQSGLNQADIVFEEIVEGQATRFAAVFNSSEANPVGPIRSGRTQDINLLLSLNDPAIAYSGANEAVNAALQDAGFELFGEGTPGFFRRDDLPAPHNLYANIAALWPQIVSSGDAVPAFEYVEPGQDVAGTPVTFVEMLVGSYDVRWDWDATQGLFLRSQLGSAHELIDGRASADNVVVLVLEYGTSPAGGGPEANTLGSGTAVVYSDGRKIEGTWNRDNSTDPFSLEAGGQPILLAPGRTWVELVDQQHNLTDG
jgi:Protein of unknown function (DUF3048) N-terminal domain/Protein of unknown function (DUF3048) C-terminal domain/Abnormal spindle-like microcephaly-assoc'd, ASPM-SPD-2-Hydin